jgi:hypothetical protein
LENFIVKNFIVKNLNKNPEYIENLFNSAALFCSKNFLYAQNNNIVIASSVNSNSQILRLDLDHQNLQWLPITYDNFIVDLICQSVTYFEFNNKNIFFINAKNETDSYFYYSTNNGTNWNKIDTINYNDDLSPTSCFQMTFFQNKLLCTSIENLEIIYGEFSGLFDFTISLNFYKTNISLPPQSIDGYFINIVNNKFVVFGSFLSENDENYFFCYFCEDNFTYTSLYSDILIDQQIYGGNIIPVNNNNYVLFVNFSNTNNAGLIQVFSETKTCELDPQISFSTTSTTIFNNNIAICGFEENGVTKFASCEYISNTPVCFLNNCFILLENETYKNITLLTEKDKIKGYFSKKAESILKIQKHSHLLKNIPVENRPYLILQHSFGKNIPNKNINVSGYHRIIIEKEKNHFIGIQTFKIPSCQIDNSYSLNDSLNQIMIIIFPHKMRFIFCRVIYISNITWKFRIRSTT